MEENYILKCNNEDKKTTKLICLSVCILLDFVSFVGVIACFSAHKYLDLIIYAVIFVIATIIRIISLFFTYEVIVSFQNDNISIVKKYPIMQISLYEGNASCLKLKKFNSLEKNCGKYVRLCPKSCENGVYMVELFDRKYLIFLDDYMFSLIEVKCDLS